MAQRPGLYWGKSDNHFHSLMAFLAGIEVARNPLLNDEAKKQLDQITPEGFTEFVRQRLGRSMPNTGVEWAHLIETETSSGDQAMKLLAALLGEFKEAKKDSI